MVYRICYLGWWNDERSSKVYKMASLPSMCGDFLSSGHLRFTKTLVSKSRSGLALSHLQ